MGVQPSDGADREGNGDWDWGYKLSCRRVVSFLSERSGFQLSAAGLVVLGPWASSEEGGETAPLLGGLHLTSSH